MSTRIVAAMLALVAYALTSAIAAVLAMATLATE